MVSFLNTQTCAIGVCRSSLSVDTLNGYRTIARQHPGHDLLKRPSRGSIGTRELENHVKAIRGPGRGKSWRRGDEPIGNVENCFVLPTNQHDASRGRDGLREIGFIPFGKTEVDRDAEFCRQRRDRFQRAATLASFVSFIVLMVISRCRGEDRGRNRQERLGHGRRKEFRPRAGSLPTSRRERSFIRRACHIDAGRPVNVGFLTMADEEYCLSRHRIPFGYMITARKKREKRPRRTPGIETYLRALPAGASGDVLIR
jgi:hypothetical protein